MIAWILESSNPDLSSEKQGAYAPSERDMYTTHAHRWKAAV